MLDSTGVFESILIFVYKKNGAKHTSGREDSELAGQDSKLGGRRSGGRQAGPVRIAKGGH